MPDIVAGGHRLEYRVTAPVRPGAPTILFLHEGLGSLSQWRDFPDRLAGLTGCGAFVYSRWGYGQSEGRSAPWPATYLHDEALETLPELIDACSLGRPVLFGHSDGGSMALICAARRPDLVRAVVTEAAHVMVEDHMPGGIARTRDRFLEGGLRDRLARHHVANTDSAFAGWSGAWTDPDFRDWDIRPLLPGIVCPVYAIQGLSDEYGTAAQVDAIAAAVTGPVETWLIDGCGHTPHREREHDVLARVAAFVERAI